MLPLIHMPRPRRRHSPSRFVLWLLAIFAALAVGVSVARGDCKYDCTVEWRRCCKACMGDGGKGDCFRACDAAETRCKDGCRSVAGADGRNCGMPGKCLPQPKPPRPAPSPKPKRGDTA